MSDIYTMDGKDSKGSHRVTTNSGKHSVEVNVRISRASVTPGDQTPHPEVSPQHVHGIGHQLSAPNNTLSNFKRGSWADLLSQGQPSKPSALNERLPLPRKALHDRHHKMASIGTQTDSDLTGSGGGTSDVSGSLTTAQIKDYTDTINQLHELCTTLKNELVQINTAKDNMERKLLGIIGDKDIIISSYQKSHTALLNRPPPPATPPPRPTASESELNQFRVIIRNVRSLINQEVEEMKRRAACPLTPPNPQLSKFLQQMSFTESEMAEDGDSHIISHQMNDGRRVHKSRQNHNGDADSSSSSSIPSIIEFGGGDLA